MYNKFDYSKEKLSIYLVLLYQAILTSSRGVAQHADQFEAGRCLITSDDIKQFESCFDKMMDLIANVELDAVIGNGSELSDIPLPE